MRQNVTLNRGPWDDSFRQIAALMAPILIFQAGFPLGSCIDDSVFIYPFHNMPSFRPTLRRDARRG